MSVALDCMKTPMISIGFHLTQTVSASISGHIVSFGYIFIHQVVLARTHRRELLAFEFRSVFGSSNFEVKSFGSSYACPQSMLHTVLLLVNMKQRRCENQIVAFFLFQATGN